MGIPDLPLPLRILVGVPVAVIAFTVAPIVEKVQERKRDVGMTETPNLDAIEADFFSVFSHLWTIVAANPVGNPHASACSVCAGETVRMRKKIRGRRRKIVRVCEGCDAPPQAREDTLFPPPAWGRR